MNNTLEKICIVIAAAMTVAACPAVEDVGGTVMPYNIRAMNGDVDKIADVLREIKTRSAITNFIMSGPGHSVRVNGILDIEGYAAIGRKMAAIARAVSADGIRIGYKMMPTVNCGIKHPWRRFMLPTGKERAFSACPGEEGFRRDFAAKCAAVAREGKPFLHMMDDDFRYFALGCFCENHLRRFSEITGVKRDRNEVVRAMRIPGDKGLAVRTAWHRLQMGDLLLMAKEASAAIAAVSPETRVGLCAPGGFPERDTAALAQALAGKHRPVVRWWGSAYTYDFPVDASGLLFSAQWSKENPAGDIECLYEADPCPRSPYYASAVRMEALISTTLACGYSAPLFEALGGRADALATVPQFLDMHARCKDRFAMLKREGGKGRLVGVQAFFDPDSRIGGSGGNAKKPLDVAAWFRSLNRLGIPVTTADASVRLIAGHHAFRTMDAAAITNLLSGGVFLDGAAAETLTELGFADLIGVKATMRDKIDFIGEHQTAWAGLGVSFYCAFHQNFGLDGCAVSRLELNGAVKATEFSNGKKRQPAITWFENALGGKVAVMAVNLARCKSPNFFNYRKRDLLVKMFRRMGGDRAVPARVLDRANMTLLANDDGNRLFLHAVNLSCDSAETIDFEVKSPYAGGTVEILDGATWKTIDAKWKGECLTIRPAEEVDVYGTLAIRISKEKVMK